MQVLITGGAGFIGSHLAELLISQGYDRLCLDDLGLDPSRTWVRSGTILDSVSTPEM